jgi:hypothetical protein
VEMHGHLTCSTLTGALDVLQHLLQILQGKSTSGTGLMGHMAYEIPWRYTTPYGNAVVEPGLLHKHMYLVS